MRNIYCSYRKNVCVTLLFLFIFLQAGYANIADPTPATVTQPDGTQLTIRLHGDEFYHFNTTLDGYTILKNPNNFYVYAERRDGRLVPGKVIANNKAMRQEAENRRNREVYDITQGTRCHEDKCETVCTSRFTIQD